MKRIYASLELLSLLYILIGYGWGRFAEELSSPFSLELNTINIFMSIAITIAVAYRSIQIIKLIWTGNKIEPKVQFTSIGLYILAIGPVLYDFILWKIYVDTYSYIILILLTPTILALLGAVNMKIEKRAS